MKLTTAQRSLIDTIVLEVVRGWPQAARFSEIDSRACVLATGKLGPSWSHRFTDASLQRLRKAGQIKMAHQRWTAVSKEIP